MSRVVLGAALLLGPSMGCTPEPEGSIGGVNPGGGDAGDTDDTDTDDPLDDTGGGDGGDSGGDGDDTGDTGDPVGVPPTRPAVVLFIGDGMGFEHVLGGGLYKNGTAGSLAMETAPYQASVITASYTGYTDSAASATAYSTGEKTWNGVLGMDANVEPVETVLERARALGMATGIVTTDEITGATPSAFDVHVSNRGDSDSIIADLLADPPDVALGGGLSKLEEPLALAEVPYITTAEELALAESLPLVGVFSDHTFPFIADGYKEEHPALLDMVGKAISLLEADEEGFVLVVEGARIDHASHFNMGEKVHLETEAFDDAIEVALGYAEGWTERDWAVLVTADHECGGIRVGDNEGAGTQPETEWRWFDHTNDDVPLYAFGTHVGAIDGLRIDNTVVYSVLEAALFTSQVQISEPPSVPDGVLDDLGESIVVQTHDTDFGAGFTQLDGLRLSSDDWGFKVGLDGVFNDEADAVLVWLDLDYGETTGVGADLLLLDEEGVLDDIVVGVEPDLELAGLGFDAVVGQVSGTYVRNGNMMEYGGLRHFSEFGALADDLSWRPGIVNFDGGNLTVGEEAATDAMATGLTENGIEVWLAWESLYLDGLPPEGAEIAVFAHALNTAGTTLSNQALPPFASDVDLEGTILPVVQVGVLSVDADGYPIGGASLAP